MANNFNASRSSQLGLGLDLTRDSINTNDFCTGQNLLRERSRNLMSSQLLTSSPTSGVHQTQPTHQRDHRLPLLGLGMGPGLGQLGLSRGAIRTNATPYPIPNRLQHQSIVNFSPSAQIPLPFIPQAREVTVTEVVRTTKFLTPTSTFGSVSSPNHVVLQAHQGRTGRDNVRLGIGIQEQPNWANLPNPMSNQVNNVMNMNPGLLANRGVPHRQVLNRQPAAMSVLAPHNTQIVGQNQDDGETVGDGRIHSLPYQKHGPYTCPKCNNMFQTSQSFAAHMLNQHYKFESMDERTKRLAAKYRRKNLRLAQPRIGFILLPQRISLKMLARNKNSAVRVKTDDGDGKGQEVRGDQGEEGSASSGLENNFTIDHMQIEQEAM